MVCAKRMSFCLLPYPSHFLPGIYNQIQRIRYVGLSFFLLLMMLLCGQIPLYAQAFINELDCDTPGADTMEFVELYDGGSGNTPLDGLVVVFFNGSDTASYDAFDLDGLTTDADGYFVLGNAAVPNVDMVFSNNGLQNGADAVALYRADDSDFPNDTPVTTTDLIDAIVYDTDDPDHLGLLVLLNAGEPQVNEDGGGDKDNHSNQRIPNGAGSLRNTSSYTQLPPTPGADNQALPSNNPPILTPIPDQTMAVNTTLEVAISATDPDGDPIALSTNNLPAFGDFTDNMDGTGTISFTPDFDDAGTYSNIEVIATDDQGLADTTNFELTVNNVNRAPTITPISNQNMNEGATLSVPITATDPDNDPLTLSADNLPAFANLTDNGDGTGSLDFSPSFDDAGAYPDIAVIATDNGGLADTTTFTLTVNNVPLPDVIINELDSDTPGSDTEEFIELFDGGTGNTVLDGLVVVFYNGSSDESYAAFDLDGFSTDGDGFFLMGDANVVPTPALLFGSTSLQNGADAVALYAGNDSDFPNGTPVTTSNLLDAIVYDTDDADDPGLLILLNSGQPQVNENGAGDKDNHSNQRIPNGTGGARNTDTHTQLSPTPGAVNVAPPPPNNPPVLNPIPDQEISEGDSVEVAVSATDPDGDPITLSANNLPAFGTFSDNQDGSGNITFKPDFDDAGVYGNIEVIATDDEGLADTTSFELTVNNVNRMPSLTTIPDQAMKEATNLIVNITASDPDGDPLTLSANHLPSFGVLTDNGDGTGTVEFSPAFHSAGIYPNIKVIATDDGGLADTTSFQLTVAESRLPRIGINELDADTPGSDMLEFVELFAGSEGNTPLDGLVLVFYNGGDDESYAAFDLDGFRTGPHGYFLAGNANVTPTPDLIFSNGLLQNGADAVALYAGNAADFPNGTAVTTTNLIDAIVYGTDDPDDPELLVLLKSGQLQVNENGQGDKDNHSNQRIPNGAGGVRKTETYVQAAPTPGAENMAFPDIAFTESNLDFGEVEIGHHTDLKPGILNLGPVPLKVISISVTGADAEQWHSFADGPFMVPPLKKHDITLRFAPTTPGQKNALLSIMTDDPDQPKLQVELTGLAFAIPKIVVVPQNLKFGKVAVGSEKAKPLRVQNVGSAPLIIENIFLRGSNTDQYLLSMEEENLTLNPETEHDIVVTFAPTSLGEKIAHVRFVTNDPENGTVNIPFDGEGVVDIPPRDLSGIVVINEIHYNPSSVQGSDTDFEFLELANTSAEPIALNGVQFTDGVTHAFALNDTLPANGFLVLASDSSNYPGNVEWSSGSLVNSGELLKLVDADGTTIDSVAYGVSPPWPETSNGAGPSLELVDYRSDNSLPENWQASAAQGGTPGAPNSANLSEPDIVVIPDAVDFGMVNLDTQLDTTITISNAGTDSLIISSITLLDLAMSEFALESDTLNALLPGMSADLNINAEPTTTGAAHDTLLIASNDPDESIVYVPLSMVVNAPPSETELVAPAWGETSDMLVWRRASDPENDAVLYTVEIAQDDQFSYDFYQHQTADSSITVDELGQNYSFTPQAFYYWRVKAADDHGAVSTYSEPGYFQFEALPTSVAATEALPTDFALSQNYPNPFNPETRIQYQLPTTAFVTLTIYDLLGKPIATLLDRQQFAAGTHTIKWRGWDNLGRPVASGVYFYQIRFEPDQNSEPSRTITRKLLLIK